MEQEMKYSIPSKELSDIIWNNSIIEKYGDDSTRESLVMKAVYFDTEDMVLSKNNMTVRVRVEGERKFATLKWGGCSTNGFHERNEINVPVSDESFIDPSVDMFKGSEDGEVLMQLAKDKPLINLLETRFLRRRIRLKYQQSLVELAIDYGSIITDAGEEPILELELELYAGNIDDLKKLGEEFAKEYGLSPENRTKFSRGVSLLKAREPKEQ
jgi:triphosphatase